MKIYKGILIHRHHEGGQIFDVVDDGPFRSLHFNSLSIQSRMQRSRPAQLVLEYTQAMMLALAYQMQPERALLIGLGGGSQARFLLEHFPGCQIDALEIEPAVTELAHRFFALPRSQRLQVHHMEAGEFLARSGPGYDLVFIDAFDQAGPVESVFEPQVLAALRARMTPQAACAINMWRGGAREYAALSHRIQTALQAPVYDISLDEDPENLVQLIPLRSLEPKGLLRNSKKLEKQTGLKLLKHLQRLARLEIPEAG